METRPHLVVIDPAVRNAEIDCWKNLSGLTSLPTTYHLPALKGFESLQGETSGICGIVLFGSASSVNDRLAWQQPLEKWLMPWLEKGVPTFGCCYGHQMLAALFGGRVEYRTPKKEKLVGFRRVELSENPLWGKAQSGEMYVTHNEIVTQVPACMRVVATSKEVAVDGLAHQTLPIWSFQPHPEATKTFIKDDGGKIPVHEEKFSFGYSILKKFLALAEKTK